MKLAARDQERNTILGNVVELRRIDTLRFVVPYLDQPALSSRAGNTICELAKEAGLQSRNKAELEQALNKTIAVCKDLSVETGRSADCRRSSWLRLSRTPKWNSAGLVARASSLRGEHLALEQNASRAGSPSRQAGCLPHDLARRLLRFSG